MILPKQTLLK